MNDQTNQQTSGFSALVNKENELAKTPVNGADAATTEGGQQPTTGEVIHEHAQSEQAMVDKHAEEQKEQIAKNAAKERELVDGNKSELNTPEIPVHSTDEAKTTNLQPAHGTPPIERPQTEQPGTVVDAGRYGSVQGTAMIRPRANEHVLTQEHDTRAGTITPTLTGSDENDLAYADEPAATAQMVNYVAPVRVLGVADITRSAGLARPMHTPQAGTVSTVKPVEQMDAGTRATNVTVGGLVTDGHEHVPEVLAGPVGSTQPCVTLHDPLLQAHVPVSKADTNNWPRDMATGQSTAGHVGTATPEQMAEAATFIGERAADAAGRMEQVRDEHTADIARKIHDANFVEPEGKPAVLTQTVRLSSQTQIASDLHAPGYVHPTLQHGATLPGSYEAPGEDHEESEDDYVLNEIGEKVAVNNGGTAAPLTTEPVIRDWIRAPNMEPDANQPLAGHDTVVHAPVRRTTDGL